MIVSVTQQHQLGDILANAITHGVGLVLAMVGAVYLIAVSLHGTVWQVVGASVFAATLILVYLCSTLYHSLVRTRARHVFQILDHAAIYLLIAGTYTPYCLVTLRAAGDGRWGWILLGIEWGLAVAGVLFKCYAVGRFEVASALVYLGQGWLAVVVVVPLAHGLGWQGLSWLAAGGMAYTLGIVFFALDRLRYFHAAWHVFVLLGSLCHYFGILEYVLAARG